MFFKKSFWTGKNIVFVILVFLLIAFAPKISGILLMFFAAYVLACALNPYVNKLMKYMSRISASTLVMFVSFNIFSSGS